MISEAFFPGCYTPEAPEASFHASTKLLTYRYFVYHYSKRLPNLYPRTDPDPLGKLLGTVLQLGEFACIPDQSRHNTTEESRTVHTFTRILYIGWCPLTPVTLAQGMPRFSNTDTDWGSRQRRNRFSLEKAEFFSIKRMKFSWIGMNSLLTTCHHQ